MHRHAANTPPERDSSPPGTAQRRSKRLSNAGFVIRIRGGKTDGSKTASRTMSQPEPAVGDQRRNPKRKAAAPPQSHVLPDNLLEEALKPLTSADIEEWDGWIELESEPAFFNTILKDLGVKDVKVQELFSLDQDSLDFLPKPVYGLIFLFQYAPFHDDNQVEDESGPTTSNACATVALLNIVMNHTAIDLGSELRIFKEATAGMSTAVRGYELGRNKFIRKMHNSFARRMDCLNADLFLENDASDAKSRKRGAASLTASRKKKPKKRHSSDYGYHFIAYVPSGGFVWELDGLRGNPQKLGSFDGDGWTNLARPQIEARMLQYEENQISFNLLSLCQSPLQKNKKSVLSALTAVRFLDSQAKTQHEDVYTTLVSNSDTQLDPNDPLLLAEYNLKSEDVAKEPPTEVIKARVSKACSISARDAASLRHELVTEARASMGEYRGEAMAAMADEERVAERKKDYGSVLHKWISKLAEKGVLEDIIKMSS
ncbi:ubiquitin carboxyl-terminal hydrolase [Cordyceps fumosorosea ARSEF 2679]|uniref:Ubiquitin carboxyl-terminal hydrolase n=1 Tax=Cordyceps fumosorosea (strain ARSEF 2679) TaxID=1081104 RepID=A0A168ECK5_CORFA|nr:ubiquitin carboxyl-terminal hydrolase [Cordyceps fumosorosea ARSEF 2679]OAA73648.1 ubiquitin carboxyl-terminal hydrolase [Cordyceps fumosorosea ARSEF 2679]